jgi:hypothetical protein
MKIIFICGSLEPGKDGVGDYSRLVATELKAHGHDAFAIALNDGFVDGELQENQGEIEVLRIGKSKSWHEKIDMAKVMIDAIKPDFLSLQFVPFSFNDKGLPFGLGAKLNKLTGNSNWHIMFHELWIENQDIKGRIIAFFQKQIIASLKPKLKPLVTHTHLPVYKRRLASIGIIANPLPVISNIPFIETVQHLNSQNFIIGFFSQVTFRAEVTAFLEKMNDACEAKGLVLKIVVIGGSSSKVADFINRPENRIISDKITHTGFLTPSEISGKISNCNLGISPVPQHVLGKSGSTAAFLSHKIPVAAPFIKQGYENEDIGLFNETAVKAIVKVPEFDAIDVSRKYAIDVAKQLTPSYLVHQFITDLSVL